MKRELRFCIFIIGALLVNGSHNSYAMHTKVIVESMLESVDKPAEPDYISYAIAAAATAIVAKLVYSKYFKDQGAKPQPPQSKPTAASAKGLGLLVATKPGMQPALAAKTPYPVERIKFEENKQPEIENTLKEVFYVLSEKETKINPKLIQNLFQIDAYIKTATIEKLESFFDNIAKSIAFIQKDIVFNVEIITFNAEMNEPRISVQDVLTQFLASLLNADNKTIDQSMIDQVLEKLPQKYHIQLQERLVYAFSKLESILKEAKKIESRKKIIHEQQSSIPAAPKEPVLNKPRQSAGRISRVLR